jgi:hypothetical protein
MTEWISVQERLPEEGEDVLIYTGFAGVDHAWRDGPDFVLYRSDSYNEALVFNEQVTHWMPLPEPPKDS